MGGQELDKPQVKATPGVRPAESVKAQTGEAIKAEGDKAAKTVVSEADQKAPAESQKPATEEIPDNKWSRYYYDLKDQVDKNPALQGPLTNMMLALLLMAAKYDHYADLMPGRFAERLETDEDLKDKKFDKEKDKDKIDKIVAGQGTESAALESLKKLQEENQKSGKKTGAEKACTRYVTNVLWGVDGIDDAASLSAYLLHTKKSSADGEVSLYNSGKFNEIKNQENIDKGTILIFVPDLKKGHKIVACATGNKDEFKYFDVEKDGDQVVIFNLRSANSPVKSELGVMAVLIPNTEAYKNAKAPEPENPSEPDKPAKETPEALKEKMQKATDEAIAKIEKGNREIERMIEEYKKNPHIPNLQILLADATEKEKTAQRTYDICKNAYEEAQKKSADVSKEKDYFDKLEAFLKTARTNSEEARKLANPEQK